MLTRMNEEAPSCGRDVFERVYIQSYSSTDHSQERWVPGTYISRMQSRLKVGNTSRERSNDKNRITITITTLKPRARVQYVKNKS